MNTDGLGGVLEPFGRFFIAKLDEAMLKRKAIPKSSKLPVYFYIDEASDYIADEPIVGKIINKLGKQNLGMIISVQGTEQITSVPVRDALQRAPIQCWTLKPPIVNISQDREEPIQVTVPLIALQNLPQVSDDEFSQLRSEMQRRFSSDPKPVDPKPVEPKLQEPTVEQPTLEPTDDPTAAKPW